MKKINCLIFFFCISSTISFSQDVSRSVFASQGGASKIGNITLEWTLGESIAETTVTTNGVFTQGFNQPFLKTISLDKETATNSLFKIVLYPNPVDELLHIKSDISQGTTLYMKLFDINGKLIQDVMILKTDADVTLNLGKYPSGFYLLKFSNAEGALIETQRLIKL